MSKLKSVGFTLIELIIVIVLIGILAATALPKFTNLTGQAKTAAAQGVAGALGAAVAVAHTQWISNGSPKTIVLEGKQNVVMSTNGWPEAATGVSDDTATATKCLEIWNGILSLPPNANIAGHCMVPACEFLVQVTTSPICEYIDEAGSGNNRINYNIITGAVTVT